MNYLTSLPSSAASACVELCLFKEARSWLHMGLAVSFDECFKRDTQEMQAVFNNTTLSS